VNKINLIIKKIENNRVFAKSIVAGNSRSISGTMDENDGEFQFILNEPGDDKYDGAFDFKIIGDTLSGTWKSFDKKLHVTGRSFKLVKQKFEYNPKLMLPAEGDYVDYFSQKIDSTSYEYEGKTEYEYAETYRMASDIITKINASTTKLEEIDLKNLKKLELEIIRNTIFARHGFSFKKKSFRQFFDPVAWYVPVSNDVSAALTSTEKSNIALLKRFEKYAEDNYDSFGR
jgi:YARHG domain